MSNPAGWKCDSCRRYGLERKRRCGWLGESGDASAALVWARKGIGLRSCPKSHITAESEALMEEFFARRRLGGMNFGELSAKQVDAFAILEAALAVERNDGQQGTGNSF